MNYKDAIEKFSSIPKSKYMIREALKEIAPKKDNWVVFWVSLISAFVLSFKLCRSETVISDLMPVLNIILQMILGIFGCLFAVYAIILAFLNDSYIKFLATTKREKICELYINIKYFESIIYLYFVGIVLTLGTMILAHLFTDDFRLFSNIYIDNAITFLPLFLYYLYIARIILELKSTIYNTIALFRISIAFKLVTFENEEEEKIIDSDK